MKIDSFKIVFCSLTCLMASLLSLRASSQTSGDFTVNAAGNETGDLTVQGEAHVGGNLDFGTTATNLSAGSLHYSESETGNTISLTATRLATSFLWQQNGVEPTPKTKMILGADNSLSLFDGGGASAIVLNPNTGLITLAGSGSGIRLSDGTILSNAASLRSVGLYTTNGTVAAAVTSDGKVNFCNGITLGANNVSSSPTSFASGSNATATGDAATAFGDHSIAQAYGSMVVGRFNVTQGNATTWVPADDLFVVGNGGSSAAPSNAFVVKKNGDTSISGNVTIAGTTTITGRSKIQVEPQGDLSMGSFTAE